MGRKPVNVEQVRDVQDYFKKGVEFYEAKNYKEAIDTFQKVVSINPADENRISELKKKLGAGSYKLAQESIAYMGYAAVHLNELIYELSDEEKEQVPIDKSLKEIFASWD